MSFGTLCFFVRTRLHLSFSHPTQILTDLYRWVGKNLMLHEHYCTDLLRNCSYILSRLHSSSKSHTGNFWRCVGTILAAIHHYTVTPRLLQNSSVHLLNPKTCIYVLVRQIIMKHNFLPVWRKHPWLCLLNTNQRTFSCLNKLHVVIKSLRGVELSLGLHLA